MSEESDDILFTERQLEVIGHMADGKTVKETAAAIGLAEKTIEYHRSCVCQKLRIEGSNYAFMTQYALAMGVTTFNPRIKAMASRARRSSLRRLANAVDNEDVISQGEASPLNVAEAPASRKRWSERENRKPA